MALAICEHDALDATTGSEEPKSAKPITKSVFDTLDEQSQDEIRSYAADIILMIHKDQVELQAMLVDLHQIQLQ